MKSRLIYCPIIVIFLLGSFMFSGKAQNPDRSFHPGCYYDTSGNKYTGLIRFRRPFGEVLYKKIDFKTNDSAKQQKINVAAIKSVIIQRDSRQDTVLKLFQTDTSTYVFDPYFGQLVLTTPNTKIYSREVFVQNNGGGMMFGGTPGYNISTPHGSVHIAGTPATMVPGTYGEDTYTEYMYIFYGEWTDVIDRINYKKVLTKAFADDPDLVKRIQSKELKFRNIGQIIEEYQYFKKQEK